MAEPIIFNNKAIDRGMASSADFNGLVTDIFHDLSNLSIAINDNQTLLSETASMIRHENDSLLSRIANLEYQLQDTKDTLNAVRAKTNVRTIRSLVNTESTVVSRTNFDVSDMYNVGLPRPVKTYDKLRITDTPNPELIVSVQEVYHTGDYTPDIFNNPIFAYDSDSTPDLLCMFDGSYDLFFARSAKSQSAAETDSLYVMMNITVPTNTINNLKANCIKLNPIPKYSLDLISIEYRDASNNSWLPIPTLLSDSNAFKTIEAIPSMIITFPMVETTEIRMVIRQSRKTTTTAYDNTSITEFFYGFQEFALQQLDISTGEVSFISKVKLESSNAYFKSVAKAELIVDDSLNQNINCNFTLYKNFDGSGVSNEIPFGDPIISNTGTLYIKAELDAKGSIIPIIKGIKTTCEVN